MQILGINGSPRGAESRTGQLVEGVLRGAASAGAATIFVDINRVNIEFCNACGNCYATGECLRADDFPGLLALMMESDGIVLGSPNYVNGPTAQLKQVIDRTADAIHCRALEGRYGCAVCTSGGGGEDRVVDYLNHVLFMLGAQTIGSVGVALGPDPSRITLAIEQAEAMGRDLADAIATRRAYPDQIADLERSREYFRNLVTANRDVWVHEFEVWADKGWL